MTDVPLDPVAIDVGGLLQSHVASLYSHLVTRQTGRAVRLAIESQLGEAGSASLSLVDLSEVSVLDFSCADEVAAKLLLRYLDPGRPRDAFFVFRGVTEAHRDPVEVVLMRQHLAVVAETAPAHYELLGDRTEAEERAWRQLEAYGLLVPADIPDVLPDPDDRAAFAGLIERRLAFRSPISGRIHALSRIVAHLLP